MNAERNDALTILFWANFATFVVHVMDESLMAGGFVAFIQRHFWSGFQPGDFATANTIWLLVIAASNIVYDIFGRKVAFLPMAFVWERVLNGLFHVGSATAFGEYSPGLASSTIVFVVFYLLCRFGLRPGHISRTAFVGSGLAALTFESLFVSSMWWAH